MSVRAAADLIELGNVEEADFRYLEAAASRVHGAPDEPDLVRAARLLGR